MNTTAKEINEAVSTMLDGLGIKANILALGDACPPFCEDQGKPGIRQFPRKNHIHGQNYRLQLSRNTPNAKPHGPFQRQDFIAVDFWNSYADAEQLAIGCQCYRQGHYSFMRNCRKHPKPVVTLADVLYCAQLSNPGMFEEWASEYGYNPDSRKAESIWRLCVTQYQQFAGMFSQVDLDKLAELVREL